MNLSFYGPCCCAGISLDLSGSFNSLIRCCGYFPCGYGYTKLFKNLFSLEFMDIHSK